MAKIKVLFVGVFNENSTNWSQWEALKNIGCKVVKYDYRIMAQSLGGPGNRDKDLKKTFDKMKPNLVILAKCNSLSNDLVEYFSKNSIVCMWYCDPYPMGGWPNIASKIRLCHFACCDKAKAVQAASADTKHSYHVCEGYDAKRDRPFDLKKEFDVSFIGNLKKDNRRDKLNKLASKLSGICEVSIFQKAYGEEHAKKVSQSKININFCTRKCASDRVYKVAAAGGFLLTEDWIGRKKIFGNNVALFKDLNDLVEKIKLYLKEESLRNEMIQKSMKAVAPYHREKWASDIIEIYKKF